MDKFCGCALAGQRSIAQVVAHHVEFALVFLGEQTILAAHKMNRFTLAGCTSAFVFQML